MNMEAVKRQVEQSNQDAFYIHSEDESKLREVVDFLAQVKLAVFKASRCEYFTSENQLGVVKEFLNPDLHPKIDALECYLDMHHCPLVDTFENLQPDRDRAIYLPLNECVVVLSNRTETFGWDLFDEGPATAIARWISDPLTFELETGSYTPFRPTSDR